MGHNRGVASGREFLLIKNCTRYRHIQDGYATPRHIGLTVRYRTQHDIVTTAYTTEPRFLPNTVLRVYSVACSDRRVYIQGERTCAAHAEPTGRRGLERGFGRGRVPTDQWG